MSSRQFWLIFLGLFSLMPLTCWALSVVFLERRSAFNALSRSVYLIHRNYGAFYALHSRLLFLIVAFFVFLGSPFMLFYENIIRFNLPMDSNLSNYIFLALNTWIVIGGILLLGPLYLVAGAWQYFSFMEIKEAAHLKARIKAWREA